MRPQKVPIRPGNNQPSSQETNQSSTNAADIRSYLGKYLAINNQQVIVENILGQGGFAFVFLVRSYNQQRYALKRMYVNNQRDLYVCQREISIVKEFSSHPNIIKYVDSCINRLSPTNIATRYNNSGRNDNDEKDDDAIYEILLLTEYCSNGSLINRLNEQRSLGILLNENQILRIFADICAAVSACHFRRPQPILHRDIKLENVLIDSRQNYVLCDFGSAIMLPPSTSNEHQQYPTSQLTTSLIQQIEEEIQRYTTLSYRAPEMIDLYSRLPLTLKIDIWAMGCLLYKLMYNTMPFGDSILAIQNGTFVIPDDMAHSYSRDLNLFVRYMLEIDINKRPDIWQVSYITYKLLGITCPIPNRCQSKLPDLKMIPMPITENEYRQQRKTASSTTKLTVKPNTDESISFGTEINPRERPQGLPTSTSLISFNQSTQRTQPVPTSFTTSPNSHRVESTSPWKFEDDFSKASSHTISLTNISTATTAPQNEIKISRARPSPTTVVSGSSATVSHQQLFPTLPPPPSSDAHTHRRSVSQTFSPTNIQSSFQKASSIDSSIDDDTSDDDSDTQLRTDLNKINVHNYSTFDSQEISDDEQTISAPFTHHKSVSTNSQNIKEISTLIATSKSKVHHPSMEEAEKDNLSSTKNNKHICESATDHPISPPSQGNNFNNQYTSHSFDQSLDRNSNDELETKPKNRLNSHPSTVKNSFNKQDNQINSSLMNNHTNPFLSAPFHRSPVTKQILTSSSMDTDRKANATSLSSCDLNSIVIGQRTSAFVPYQKREATSNYSVAETNNCLVHAISEIPHSKSADSNISNTQTIIPADVFTNAPFKAKSKKKTSFNNVSKRKNVIIVQV